MQNHRRHLRASMCLAAGVVMASAALAAPTALAATSLQGEEFDGEAVMTNVMNCDGAGPASFSYSSQGSATGPYPGTYEETGTVTMDEDDETLISWEADFTITSSEGTVTGHKSFVGSTSDGSSFCARTSTQSSGADAIGLDYTAETPTGTDVGTSDAHVNAYLAVNGFSYLREDFASTGFTPGGGQSAKQCRKNENARHRTAITDENATHRNNRMAEKARHRSEQQRIKDLPKNQRAAAQKQEDQTHKTNVRSEQERHRNAVKAEAALHKQNLASCAGGGGGAG